MSTMRVSRLALHYDIEISTKAMQTQIPYSCIHRAEELYQVSTDENKE